MDSALWAGVAVQVGNRAEPPVAKVPGRQSVVCLGAVIRGETSHYDYVCEQVSSGCQRVSLDYDLPVIFGVLTTENEAQASHSDDCRWRRLCSVERMLHESD